MSVAESSTVYVGTYTRRELFVDGKAKGIYTLRFDPNSGALSHLATVGGRGTTNPSYLALASDKSTLYAVNEITGAHGTHGTVSAFRIGAEGRLTFLNQQSTGGLAPCFVGVTRSSRWVLVANYETGSVAVFPVGSEGELGEASDLVQNTGSGPHPERQKGPHAHMIVSGLDDKLVLVVDLGADQLLAYRLDEDLGRLHAEPTASVGLSAGSGPRHIALHPRRPFAYVIGELDSTIVALRYKPEDRAFHIGSVVSTLPLGLGGDNLGAEIGVAPSGRFLYATNRGHDSIAHYRINEETGELMLIGHTPSEGQGPRFFTLDTSGNWLLVANQDSDTVVTFPVDQRNGEIGSPAQVAGVPTPVCLTFGKLPVPTRSVT